MKSKTINITLIVTGLFALIGFALFKLYRVNTQLKANLPYLIIGESIEYFDLLDEDANQISASVLKNGHPAMIFIFARPCSPCNKNIVYWKKMAQVLGQKMDFYGIVLGDATEAFNFAETAKLNFKIYAPVDMDKFIKVLRIKMSYSQTILYAGDEVKYLKQGILEAKEAINIINIAKESI